MERKRKKINVKFIVLILSLIVFLGMSVFTFAWFTDTKSYTGTLNFGELKLKVSGGVSGDGVTSATSKIDFDVTRSSGPSYTLTKKVMPGDTININLTIDLETGSEPAYYIVKIYDSKNIFENNTYFSEDGTIVYVYDGVNTYNQNDSTKTSVSDKYCGKITAGSAQNLKISAKVSEDYTTQKETTQVECKVLAIQRANLEPKIAKKEMNLSYGRNLYSLQDRVFATSNGYENATQRVLTGNQIFVGITANNYWEPSNVASDYSITQDKITMTNVSTSHYGIGFDFNCQAGQQYIINANVTNGEIRVGYYYSDGSWGEMSVARPSGEGIIKHEFSVPSWCKNIVIVFLGNTVNVLNTFTDIKIIQN